jgi:hypothetical protein
MCWIYWKLTPTWTLIWCLLSSVFLWFNFLFLEKQNLCQKKFKNQILFNNFLAENRLPSTIIRNTAAAAYILLVLISLAGIVMQKEKLCRAFVLTFDIHAVCPSLRGLWFCIYAERELLFIFYDFHKQLCLLAREMLERERCDKSKHTSRADGCMMCVWICAFSARRH